LLIVAIGKTRFPLIGVAFGSGPATTAAIRAFDKPDEAAQRYSNATIEPGL
jgi:hypothetical protein